jgi:hypothetical protein
MLLVAGAGVSASTVSPTPTSSWVMAKERTGPGSCRDDYNSYMGQIADEYAACRANQRWYDAWGCDFQWAVESELAMGWLIACDASASGQ